MREPADFALERRVKKALDLAWRYGQGDDSLERAWVIDQMVRALLGGRYAAWLAAYKADRRVGGDPYWSDGVRPRGVDP